MYAVLVEIDLHIPASRSLKDKRGVIRRVQARLQRDLHVSVAEVAYQDTWQRSTLGIAIATGDAIVGGNVARDAEKLVQRFHDAEITDVRTQIVQMEGRSTLLDLVNAVNEEHLVGEDR